MPRNARKEEGWFDEASKPLECKVKLIMSITTTSGKTNLRMKPTWGRGVVKLVDVGQPLLGILLLLVGGHLIQFLAVRNVTSSSETSHLMM